MINVYKFQISNLQQKVYSSFLDDIIYDYFKSKYYLKDVIKASFKIKDFNKEIINCFFDTLREVFDYLSIEIYDVFEILDIKKNGDNYTFECKFGIEDKYFIDPQKDGFKSICDLFYNKDGITEEYLYERTYEKLCIEKYIDFTKYIKWKQLVINDTDSLLNYLPE